MKLPSGRDVPLAGQKSGMVYGLDPQAGGKVLWRTKVGAGGLFGGIERGMAACGSKVAWDFDTAKSVPAVNADSAYGGSLDAGGPVVVNGTLYVNSGYGQFLGHGGNVLLASSVDGK